MSRHKEMAADFLRMASSGDVRRAYEKFIAPDFIHHNFYFKGDRESLMIAMEEAHRTSPNATFDVRRTLEESDTVVTHSRVVRGDPEATEIAVVHIFRFANDRVVELWDLGQLINKDSPNENGPF